MEKLTIIMILSFLLPSFLWSQNRGIINYKLSIKTQIENTVVNKIIYFNGSESIEFGVSKNVNKGIEKKSETELNETRVLTSKKQIFIYKKVQSNKLMLSDYIMAKKYLISDTLNNFNWKITAEHQKVLNYLCTKAILNFRGRNYTIWFTEQIPLRFGPWKFCCLPGLIVKASDSEQKFVYELTGIDLRAKFEDKIIAIPSAYFNDKAITYKEFMILYKKKLDDNVKLSRVKLTAPGGASGIVTITLPEKMEKF